jgi:serine/threonine-protein kinase HipA
LDYLDLIKASRQLCQSPDVGRLQFRRAVFNLFAANQDDHSKNWSFLQNDDGEWSVAPFYGVTFSPHPFNQHATAFGGYGNQPPVKTLERLAVAAGFSTWQEARAVVQEVADAVSHFDEVAVRIGVSKTTIAAIGKTLKQRKDDNKTLLR